LQAAGPAWSPLSPASYSCFGFEWRPLAGAIPSSATAPALIIIGALMISHISEIDGDCMGTAIPAFLTITAIPLTLSIANSLAFGSSAKVVCGEFRSVNWLVYVLTGLFLLRFYPGSG
jgi:adenine/guanine/hypoxanthine permease